MLIANTKIVKTINDRAKILMAFLSSFSNGMATSYINDETDNNINTDVNKDMTPYSDGKYNLVIIGENSILIT